MWLIEVTIGVSAITIDDWVPRAIDILFLLAAIPAAFFMETHVDPQRGQVVRIARLFGLILSWRRILPIGDFSGIHYICKKVSGDNSDDTWIVVLKPRSGRVIELRQFTVPDGERCLEAATFAREVSQLMGLEVFTDDP